MPRWASTMTTSPNLMRKSRRRCEAPRTCARKWASRQSANAWAPCVGRHGRRTLHGCASAYPVTSALLAQGVDVLTAQWDDTTRLPDPELLDQASALGRVLVSQDEDLLAEAAQWQRAGGEFAGLIYAHQRSITTARFIDDLELIALGVSSSEMINRVEFLPL